MSWEKTWLLCCFGLAYLQKLILSCAFTMYMQMYMIIKHQEK